MQRSTSRKMRARPHRHRHRPSKHHQLPRRRGTHRDCPDRTRDRRRRRLGPGAERAGRPAAVSADRCGGSPRCALRRRARAPGRIVRRAGLPRLVPLEHHRCGVDRIHRRQARRRVSVVDRRGRRPGHPDLLERGLHPPAALPRMTETPTPASGHTHRSRSAWWRLGRAMAPRASRAQAIVAVLCAVLGFAVVTQVHSAQQNDLSTLRQDDLVRLLDGVTRQADLLEKEAATLRGQQTQLESGTDKNRVAQQAAEVRAGTQGILAGRLPAEGPGIQLTVYDPVGVIKAATLFNILEELRNAGAEAIQLEDRRITASSYIVDTAGGVIVDGSTLTAPYTWLAIGNSHDLLVALEIPGGVIAAVRQLGGDANLTESAKVTIDAKRAPSAPQYATPKPADRP